MTAKIWNMNSFEFIAKNKLPYAYAWYYLDNGEKITLVEKNNIPLNELEEYKEKTKSIGLVYNSKLKRRITSEEKKTKCHKVFSVYLKYVEDIVCIDCDSEDVHDPTQLGEILGVPSINNSMCWTPGNNKGFHIYVRIPNFNKTFEGIKVFGEGYPNVDIIKYNRNVWEREDKLFANEISTFDISEIKHLLKSNKRKLNETETENKNEELEVAPSIKTETCEFCPMQERIFTEVLYDNLIGSKLFTQLPSEYDDWINYGFILVNAQVKNIAEVWLNVCQQLKDSGNSSKDERLEKLQQLQNSPKSKKPITFRSLLTILQKMMGKEYNLFMKEVNNQFKAESRKVWYELTKEKFEKTHFEFKGRVMQIQKDYTLHQWQHIDANKAYAHLHIKNGENKLFFLDMWHQDTNKRIIENIIMRPDLPKELDPVKFPNTYNTFQGYLIESHDNIRVQLTLDELDEWKNTSYICWMIWNQLCNEDEETYTEVMQTFANLLFAPQDIGRYHSCLTFYSDTEGVGKSLITNMFVETIIGLNYACKTSKMDDIFGKYTELAENKILVVIEEGKKSEGVAFADVAKDWLTSETTIVHKKCQSKYVTNNCCHLICNTNNKSVWKVSETNRRYLISHCKEVILRKDYLKDVLEEIKNLDSVVKFCRVLYTIWNKEWQCETYIQNQYKSTEIYKEQLKDQISQIDMFFKQFIIDTDLQLTHNLHKEVKPLELYNIFRYIMSNCGLQDKDVWTNRRFGEQLKKIPGVEQNGYRNYKIAWKTIEDYLLEKHLLE